jgi:hypothetical protein
MRVPLLLKSRSLGCLALGALLLVVGCSSDIPGSAPGTECDPTSQQNPCANYGPTDANTPEVPVESAAPTAALNQPFEFRKTYSDSDKVDTWQVTLTQVKCGLTSITNGADNPEWRGGDEVPEYLPAKPEIGDEFCVTYWSWTNVGKGPASTGDAGDLLIGDERFAMDDESLSSNTGKDQLGKDWANTVDINPRKSTRTLNVYAVPVGSTARAVLFPNKTVYTDSTMLIAAT